MKRFLIATLWVIAIGLILAGVQIDYGPPIADWPGVAWLWAADKPTRAIIVRESGDPLKLTTEQTAWIMSPKLRADCKAAGIKFYIVDPDEKDRDGKTPAELAPAIKRAVDKGLPRLILVGVRGGLQDYVLPTDEQAARKKIGIGG